MGKPKTYKEMLAIRTEKYLRELGTIDPRLPELLYAQRKHVIYQKHLKVWQKEARKINQKTKEVCDAK